MIISTTWIWGRPGVCGIQTHVYSMFSSLLLIESHNKTLEVQLITELACKLICHRKCFNGRSLGVSLQTYTQSFNHMFAFSKQFIQLEMKFYNTYIYIRTYIHNLRPSPSCIHIYYVPHTKTLVTDASHFSWVLGSKGHYYNLQILFPFT